ncbi:hypothetical protein [Butyrivibrio sp. M55]|uniref:hypothetical protein n=1 Tax=Butyrivibrio sp. M55 TaxID=1855323 RepID=UPI0008E5BD81|nr:hypothetical protein [Butyrivibrio sp. M55]SFU79018.1 hypothetical protein SAMN05216540_11037 [Butyrivibrio sp. M55]
MVESDFLDMNQLNIQCDESISVLSESNVRLNGIRDVYKAANSVIFMGRAASNFLKQCEAIVTLIGAIITANDCDIMDNKTLKSFLTEGLVLDGREILTKKREAAENEQREWDEAEECERRSHGTTPEEKHYWRHEYRFHKQAAESYRREKEFWESRERLFDEINNATANLFENSESYRDAANKGIEYLSTNFDKKTGTFELNDSWKDGIEKLCDPVSIKDKCKEKWKDENGAYNLEALKEVLNTQATEITATEAEAFAEVLEELHPDAQKQLVGKVVNGKIDGKGLVQGIIGSVGPIGKTFNDIVNMAISGDDMKARRKAGYKFMKDFLTGSANWTGTLAFTAELEKNKDDIFFDAKKTLYSSCEKGSFIKSISQEGDDLVNVSAAEVAKRSLKSDFNSYFLKSAEKARQKAVISAIQNDLPDDAMEALANEAEAAAKVKNFKTGVKWLGVVADVAFNAADNFSEQELARKSGIEMSNERVAAETVLETATDTLLSSVATAAVGAGLSFVIGTTAPVVVVAAISVVAVWGVNEAFKAGKGKDAGEYLADVACDFFGIK